MAAVGDTDSAWPDAADGLLRPPLNEMQTTRRHAVGRNLPRTAFASAGLDDRSIRQPTASRREQSTPGVRRFPAYSKTYGARAAFAVRQLPRAPTHSHRHG